MFIQKEYKPFLGVQVIIKDLLVISAYTMNMSFILAIAFYPEKYSFFAENISKLGGIRSVSGTINTTSMIIILVGFGICGIITLAVGILYLKYRKLHLWKVKAIVSFIISLGAFLMMIPHDFMNLLVVHGIGAVLYIGGFTSLNVLLQVSSTIKKQKEFQKSISRFDTIWDIILSIILSLILIGYFVIFPIARCGLGPVILEQTYQKLVVFTALLAIYFIDDEDI